MRNFDYIRDLGLNDLYRFCSAAEDNQVSSPDFSAINARKALEYIVRSLYFMKNIEVSERSSLFELIDGERRRVGSADDAHTARPSLGLFAQVSDVKARAEVEFAAAYARQW